MVYRGVAYQLIDFQVKRDPSFEYVVMAQVSDTTRKSI